MLDITFAKPGLPKAGGLALFVADGAELSGLARALDEKLEGGLGRALKANRFTGKKHAAVVLYGPGAGLNRVVVIGTGKDAAQGHAAEELGGIAAQHLAEEPEAAVDASALGRDVAAQVALGATLRHWRFDKYRTKEKPEDKPKLGKLSVLTEDATAARAAWKGLAATAEGVFLTREVVSEPPNVLTPAEFATRCEALTRLGLEVEVMGPRELKRLGFHMMLAVAQGSVNEARFVVMRWNGASAGAAAPRSRARSKASPERKPLCFVGKGVTFDTGGISIKPAAGMEDMKWDMAGAGTVAGLMATLAGRAAKCDAVGLLGLVENMPSGNAQRPGDVVQTYSGQTVEVINTDAEGRLVLGDVLWWAQEKLDPRFMIDLATLTGAMVIALGHENTGYFANDDALAQAIEAAGRATGEPMWRMPLGEAYDKQIKSDIADMKNVGGRPGGAITAAQFLQRFVNGKPWAHLDIAGTAWNSKDKPTVPKGASAVGVRMLDRLVADGFEA